MKQENDEKNKRRDPYEMYLEKFPAVQITNGQPLQMEFTKRYADHREYDPDFSETQRMSAAPNADRHLPDSTRDEETKVHRKTVGNWNNYGVNDGPIGQFTIGENVDWVRQAGRASGNPDLKTPVPTGDPIRGHSGSVAANKLSAGQYFIRDDSDAAKVIAPTGAHNSTANTPKHGIIPQKAVIETKNMISGVYDILTSGISSLIDMAVNTQESTEEVPMNFVGQQQTLVQAGKAPDAFVPVGGYKHNVSPQKPLADASPMETGPIRNNESFNATNTESGYKSSPMTAKIIADRGRQLETQRSKIGITRNKDYVDTNKYMTADTVGKTANRERFVLGTKDYTHHDRVSTDVQIGKESRPNHILRQKQFSDATGYITTQSSIPKQANIRENVIQDDKHAAAMERMMTRWP
jgi:hypothetical protein